MIVVLVQFPEAEFEIGILLNIIPLEEKWERLDRTGEQAEQGLRDVLQPDPMGALEQELLQSHPTLQHDPMSAGHWQRSSLGVQ